MRRLIDSVHEGLCSVFSDGGCFVAVAVSIFFVAGVLVGARDQTKPGKSVDEIGKSVDEIAYEYFIHWGSNPHTAYGAARRWIAYTQEQTED